MVTNEWTPLTNFPLLFHFPSNFFEIFSFPQVKPNKNKLLVVLLWCFVFQFEKLGGHFGSKAQLLHFYRVPIIGEVSFQIHVERLLPTSIDCYMCREQLLLSMNFDYKLTVVILVLFLGSILLLKPSNVVFEILAAFQFFLNLFKF